MNNTQNMMSEEAIREKYLRPTKTKLQLAKIASALMIAAALFVSWFVSENTQNISINIIDMGRRSVWDEAEILSDATIKKIDDRGAALAELTGGKAKIAVFTEKEKNSDLKKKAETTFKSHEVGDDGMLFIANIHKSSGGVGGVLESIGDSVAEFFGGGSQVYASIKGRNVDYISDAEIKKILDDNFADIDEENFDCNAAFLSAYNELADIADVHYGIDSKNYAPEVDALATDSTHESHVFPYTSGIFQIGVGTGILFVLLFCILTILITKKKPGVLRVYKKSFWFKLIG